MSKEVEDVMQTLMQQDPSLPLTCLLADVRIPFAQCLADKFSVARIAFWTQSAASFSYHSAIATGIRLPTDELAIVDCIPGVPAHTISETPIMLRRQIIGDYILDFILKPFSQLNEASCAVINTFESLEADTIEAMREHGWNVIPVGPLLPLRYFDNSALSLPSLKCAEDAKVEEKHTCLEWLDARKPASVLYISFGTLVCLEAAEFKELALGVEASGRSFLWSLRLDTVEGNLSSFIETFAERTKQRGLVVPWVPQLKVLSHASIGGFLTHCGWNSSLESMCRGVPMIGRPIFGEQKLNMKCLVDCWKIGLAMKGEAGRLSRDEVKKNVCALFVGPEVEELRSSTAKMREKAVRAVTSNGSSVSNFKLVLKLVQEGAISQ